MASIASVLALAAALVFSAESIPKCGDSASAASKVDPEEALVVVVASAGEACGNEGPRRRVDCQPPAGCFSTDGHGAQCTMPCAQDPECAPLGTGFTCDAKGTPYLKRYDEPRTLCRRSAGQ